MEITYDEFVRFVNKKPDGETIDHGDDEASWSNCAVGQFAAHAECTIDAVCEVLSRANEPLFDALNERGETEKEYDIETYGDLKRFIKDTE